MSNPKERYGIQTDISIFNAVRRNGDDETVVILVDAFICKVRTNAWTTGAASVNEVTRANGMM